MNKQEVIDQYAARLLMVSFFLPMKMQIYVVFLASVYFVFRTLFSKQFPPARNYLWALLSGGIFLLYLFSVPFTPPEYRKLALHLCEREESLLLMPLVFGIISNHFRELIFSARTYFVYACLICCVAGNADYVYHYFFVQGGLHTLSHVRYRVIFESFTGFHPTYMAIYLAFSICILLCSEGFNMRGGLMAKYVLIYVLFVFFLSLMAKSPLIALVIIFIHYGYVNRKLLFRNKLLISGMAASVVAACILIPFVRQRMGEIIQFLGIGKPGASNVNSFYDRTMIFNTDIGMIRDYWLTGVGPGRLIQTLHERYFFYSLINQSPVASFDPHNEYFALWLSFGILGVLSFAAILAVHYIKAIRSNNTLYLYLLIILTITFFTESVLLRQQGVLFYAVFTSLFFYRKPFVYDQVSIK